MKKVVIGLGVVLLAVMLYFGIRLAVFIAKDVREDRNYQLIYGTWRLCEDSEVYQIANDSIVDTIPGPSFKILYTFSEKGRVEKQTFWPNGDTTIAAYEYQIIGDTLILEDYAKEVIIALNDTELYTNMNGLVTYRGNSYNSKGVMHYSRQ